MPRLKKYWFEFETSSKPEALNLGCGVTAESYEDALSLITEHVFTKSGSRTIKSYVEDIAISDLEANHVQPNVGSADIRGIWFPQGY